MIFELIGSGLTWINVYRVWKDKGYAGIYLPAVVFFWAWGLWSCFYYPYLDQWWSFVGGLMLVIANFFWTWLMVWYGRIRS